MVHSITKISFIPLAKEHFPFLAQWLNTPHVAAWWGEGRAWALADVVEKYQTYVDGTKPLGAYIIQADNQPIGYIQVYNAYDFPRGEGVPLENLPASLAAIDWYIGDPAFVGKGLSAHILQTFLTAHVWLYFAACFVDPDIKNTTAIRSYEKAGFREVRRFEDKGVIWMLNPP